jgi:hypothetical protein
MNAIRKTHLYVDPKLCFHTNLKVNNLGGEQLNVECRRCGLEGSPVEVGKLPFGAFWARSAAFSAFYKIAVRVDKMATFILSVIIIGSGSISCGNDPDSFFIDDDLSELDAGGETDLEDSESEQLDTELDTDTEQLDTDTDSSDHECPWLCRPNAGEDACSPDNIDDPIGVHNRNFTCRGPNEICCQPWPPTDDLGIDVYCLDKEGFECAQACSSPDLSRVCFAASNHCCRKDPDD